MRAVSLFSNCGAGDLGYRQAGFQFDVMAELDPRRLEVCLLNHPGAVGIAGDLRSTWQEVVAAYRKKAGKAKPALLCACPPCQGMSSARTGKGRHDDLEAGSRDERNLLVTVIAKVTKELQPSVLVVENVPAFLSRSVRHPRDGKAISAAAFLIQALSADYLCFPFMTDLSNYDVPQSRKRAFLTFVRGDLSGAEQMLRLGKGPYPRPRNEDACSAPENLTLKQALKAFDLPPLDARQGLASCAGYGDLHAVPVWSERLYAMVQAIPPGTGRSAWDNDKCPSCGIVEAGPTDATCPTCGDALLRPVVEGQDGKYRLVRGFRTSYRRMSGDRPAATITTASGHVGSDYTIHPTENRLLSTLECALLQTIPKSFKWGEALQKWGHTNVREMIGEAVPPAFTHAHGRLLAGILRGKWTAAPIALSDARMTRAWACVVRAAKKDNRRLSSKSTGHLL